MQGAFSTALPTTPQGRLQSCAARGRPRLSYREEHRNAPVKLSAAQSGPWHRPANYRPKTGTVKVVFFCSFTTVSCAFGPKWNCQARVWVYVSKFFLSELQNRNVLVSMKPSAMTTGRATREALLSEVGFENVFQTQN